MHTVAVDAKTGKEVWRTKMGDVTHGETMTMAPLVVGNKVYVGNSGGELGVWGWLAALDVDTGKELWRAYSTGTDEQVKIGPDFKPFYSWMKGKDLGKTSWPPGMDRTGAGSVWAWISYDPETNLIYYGTSNPSPRVPTQRPGYNLWTSAIFARDATTGMAKWAYQFTPHDQWDYDGVNENVLIDINFQGRPRKALIHFDRNAFAYTMDRTTGEVLVGAAVRVPELVEGHRPEDRHADRRARDAAEAERQAAERLPARHRRQGLAAVGVLAAHGPRLRRHLQHLHGRDRPPAVVHRRHAVRRHGDEALRRAGRQLGRVHGLGSGRRQEGRGRSRKSS